MKLFLHFVFQHVCKDPPENICEKPLYPYCKSVFQYSLNYPEVKKEAMVLELKVSFLSVRKSKLVTL